MAVGFVHSWRIEKLPTHSKVFAAVRHGNVAKVTQKFFITSGLCYTTQLSLRFGKTSLVSSHRCQVLAPRVRFVLCGCFTPSGESV
jgi:hypothetical protein